MTASADTLNARLPARASAPAKINLGLFVGPARDDGRHELATVMQSISLADELTLSAASPGAGADEVRCPALPGPPSENLALRALVAFRERTGWDAPPLSLEIVKSIPLAAGLGGGSADAAAALRLAHHASGLGDEEILRELAAQLGADVPAQVAPGRWLAGGAGERLQALSAPPRSPAVLVLALHAELSTAAVYAQADRLGLPRDRRELAERREALEDLWREGSRSPDRAVLADSDSLDNDLQQAAVSLCPQIDEALAQARHAGADRVLVSGSGPTVLGLFAAPDAARGSQAEADEALARARAGADELRGRVPAPVSAAPVDGAFAAARTLA